MTSELGSLLKKMIDILRAHRNQTMQDTLAYLESRLGYSPHAIRKWCQGRHKPDVETLACLVEIGVAETGMDRAWAERVLHQGEHPQHTTILHRLFPPAVPLVRHNLPRRPYIRLVGRQKELAEVTHRLAPESRHWLVPIEGVGGVGKSALAVEVGWRFVEGYDRLPPSRRFDAIVWISAKSEVLTARGIESCKPTFANLDDVYKAIAEVLDHPAILRVPHRDQPREVERSLRRGGRSLIILDNLETVDDPQVLAFLRDLPPPTKAVATMRFHEDMPYPIRLKELEQSAAWELAAQECTSRGIAPSNDEMGRLLAYTRGLPLAIWWAVGLMGMEGYGVETALQRLRKPEGDLLCFIFNQAATRLRAEHPEAYHTLLALTFFNLDSGATLAPLAATVDLDEEATRVALHRLLNLNLINRTETGHHFTLLPLTHDFARTELATVPAQEQRARERWARWYLQWAQDRGQSWRRYNELEQDIPNLLEVALWYRTRQEWCALIQLEQALSNCLYTRGHWKEGLELAEMAQEACQHSGDDLAEARCIIKSLDTYYSVRGERDRRRNSRNRALEILRRHDTKNCQAEALILLSRLAYDQENFEQSQTLASQAVVLWNELGERKRTRDTLIQLGNCTHKAGHLSEAEAFFHQAWEMGKDLDSPDLDGTAIGNLGKVARDVGDYERGEKLFQEAITLFRRVGKPYYVARVKQHLAILEAKRENWEAALDLLKESISEYCRLGAYQFYKDAVKDLLEWTQRWSKSSNAFLSTKVIVKETIALFRELGREHDAREIESDYLAVTSYTAPQEQFKAE